MKLVTAARCVSSSKHLGMGLGLVLACSEKGDFESLSAKSIDPTKYRWYKYEGKEKIEVKSVRFGKTYVIRNGILFGIRNLDRRRDTIVFSAVPEALFVISTSLTNRLLDDSARHRGQVSLAVNPTEGRGRGRPPSMMPKLAKHKLSKPEAPAPAQAQEKERNKDPAKSKQKLRSKNKGTESGIKSQQTKAPKNEHKNTRPVQEDFILDEDAEDFDTADFDSILGGWARKGGL